MQQPSIVGLDLDGVLAKFNEALIRTYNRRHGHLTWGPIRLEDWRQYRIEHQFLPAQADMLYAIFREPGFFASLEQCEGAYAAVREILAAGYQVEVCSQPPFAVLQSGRKVVDAHSAADKIGWLVREMPELATGVTLTDKKHLQRYDALVDDSHSNIARFCEENKHAFGYLVVQPYNEGLALPPNAVRGTVADLPRILRVNVHPVREVA